MEIIDIFNIEFNEKLNFSIQTTDKEVWINLRVNSKNNLGNEEDYAYDYVRKIVSYRHNFDKNNVGYNLKRFGSYH